MRERMFMRGGVLGVALLLLTGVAQGTLIIDAFEFPLAGTGQAVCQGASPCGTTPSSIPYTAADPVLEQIIGGTRFMQVMRTSGAGLGVVRANAGGTDIAPDPDVPFSSYRFSSAAGIAGWGYVRWDGITAPVDLTEAATNTFILAQATADLTGGYLAIALTDAANNTTTNRVQISTIGGADYVFPLANFAGVDVTQITKIELGVGGADWTPINRTGAPPNFDVTVHLLQSTHPIPEPGTLILGGLGLIGIGLLRRRRA